MPFSASRSPPSSVQLPRHVRRPQRPAAPCIVVDDQGVSMQDGGMREGGLHVSKGVLDNLKKTKNMPHIYRHICVRVGDGTPGIIIAIFLA
uniref:Uncharacterized protein n=1 Tax=Oryza glumipatula TaxID=40148 RepID=A0A0E0BJJ3_9ORYZ